MRSPFIKSIVLAPAALTSLLALLTIGLMATAGSFYPIRLLAAVYALGMGVWAIWHVFRGGNQFALLAGAFVLAVIGSAGATYGLLQTADPEYWAVLLCMALVAQGGCTINYLWIRKPYA